MAIVACNHASLHWITARRCPICVCCVGSCYWIYSAQDCIETNEFLCCWMEFSMKKLICPFHTCVCIISSCFSVPVPTCLVMNTSSWGPAMQPGHTWGAGMAWCTQRRVFFVWSPRTCSKPGSCHHDTVRVCVWCYSHDLCLYISVVFWVWMAWNQEGCMNWNSYLFADDVEWGDCVITYDSVEIITKFLGLLDYWQGIGDIGDVWLVSIFSLLERFPLRLKILDHQVHWMLVVMMPRPLVS